MIVTSGLVFLHLHKSGGSFVNHLLHRHFPDAREIGYHLPRSLIPPACAGLPVLGLVRNPWSYYVSWYSFQRQRPRPNALFRAVSEEGRLDFGRTIGNLLDLGRDDALLARAVDGLPNEYGTRGLNLPGFALAGIRGSRAGFYSFLYDYMYSPGNPAADPAPSLHVRRMEELPIALLDLLDAAGQPADAGFRKQILQSPVRNASAHRHYAEYYSPALRDHVGLCDATVIDRHGYTFEA